MGTVRSTSTPDFIDRLLSRQTLLVWKNILTSASGTRQRSEAGSFNNRHSGESPPRRAYAAAKRAATASQSTTFQNAET